MGVTESRVSGTWSIQMTYGHGLIVSDKKARYTEHSGICGIDKARREAGLFHKWRSYLLLTINKRPTLPLSPRTGYHPTPSSPFNPPFPWLMTPAALAASLIAFTIGKMVFTDVQRVPPSRVSSANAVMSL